MSLRGKVDKEALLAERKAKRENPERSTTPDTVRRVNEFLSGDDMKVWFALLCEHGAFAIESQAWQVSEELGIGRQEAEDAMMQLAYDQVPDSPAASKDPKDLLFWQCFDWANDREKSVQDYVQKSVQNSECQDAADSGVYSLRIYLRKVCQEALRLA